MSDKELRKAIIRLAHEKPELRPELLPILKSAARVNIRRELGADAEKERYRLTSAFTDGLEGEIRQSGETIILERAKTFVRQYGLAIDPFDLANIITIKLSLSTRISPDGADFLFYEHLKSKYGTRFP